MFLVIDLKIRYRYPESYVKFKIEEKAVSLEGDVA